MAEANEPSGIPLPDTLAGNFQDAVRWFNQFWGGATEASGAGRIPSGGAIPSMLMPTLDIKELDKRIADLRSVEHWLTLNQGLLHTTIQGLEMQRNTLAAWQAIGAGAGSAQGPGGTGAAPAGAAPEAPAFQPALWWAALQQQFAQMAASAAEQQAAAKTEPQPSEPPEAPAPAAKAPGKPRAAGPARGSG